MTEHLRGPPVTLSFLLTQCIIVPGVDPTLPPIHVLPDPLTVTEFRIFTDGNK